MEDKRFPLAWPLGWKRTADRKPARFVSVSTQYGPSGGAWKRSNPLTVAQGFDRLASELDKLKAREVVISTNVQINSRGEPYSGRRDPDDPGAAVYFKLGDKPRVLACDRWTSLADNLAAIAAHIDAIRRIERYGVGTLEQAFTGYDALPAPINKPHWRKIFGVADSEHITEKVLRDRYRVLAMDLHRQNGAAANHEAMTTLNIARDEALTELGYA